MFVDEENEFFLRLFKVLQKGIRIVKWRIRDSNPWCFDCQSNAQVVFPCQRYTVRILIV